MQRQNKGNRGGLSPDPAKAKRQLDALAAGRRALADAETKRASSTPAPAVPSPDATGEASQAGSTPAATGADVEPAPSGSLGLPVHTYGEPPKPPKPPEPDALPLTPEQEAMNPPTTVRRPRALRELFGGLRDGA